MNIPEQGLGYLRPYETPKGPHYTDIEGKGRPYDGPFTAMPREYWLGQDRRAFNGFMEEPLVKLLVEIASFRASKPTVSVEFERCTETETIVDKIDLPITESPTWTALSEALANGKLLAEIIKKQTLGRLAEVARPANASDPEEPLRSAGFYGPYLVIHSGALHTLSDRVHCTVKAEADLLVQLSPDVFRYVIGFFVTTVRAEDGFKAICCMAPQIRKSSNGAYGICRLAEYGK